MLFEMASLRRRSSQRALQEERPRRSRAEILELGVEGAIAGVAFVIGPALVTGEERIEVLGPQLTAGAVSGFWGGILTEVLIERVHIYVGIAIAGIITGILYQVIIQLWPKEKKEGGRKTAALQGFHPDPLLAPRFGIR